MAEAIGVAASIIQLASFGLSTAKELYEFANTVKTHSKQIQRLARHVEQNARLLERLRKLLKQDEDAGLSIKNDFRQDILGTIQSCHDVVQRLMEAVEIGKKVDDESSSKSKLFKFIGKSKFVLSNSRKIEEFRNELSQCEITLQLMLVIHWRPPTNHYSEVNGILKRDRNAADRARSDERRFSQDQREIQGIGNGIQSNGDRTSQLVEPHQTDIDTLISNLGLLRHSSIRPVARAVNDFITSIAQIQINTEHQHNSLKGTPSQVSPRGEKHLPAFQSIFKAPTLLDPWTNETLRMGESNGDESRSSPVGSSLSRSNVSRTDTFSSQSTETSKVGSKRSHRTMWIGRRDDRSPYSWAFDRAPISERDIDAFVWEKASKVLETLSDMDCDTYAVVREHVECLREHLIAIHVRRRQRVQYQDRSDIATMNFVTEKQATELEETESSTSTAKAYSLGSPGSERLTKAAFKDNDEIDLDKASPAHDERISPSEQLSYDLPSSHLHVNMAQINTGAEDNSSTSLEKDASKSEQESGSQNARGGVSNDPTSRTQPTDYREASKLRSRITTPLNDQQRRPNHQVTPTKFPESHERKQSRSRSPHLGRGHEACRCRVEIITYVYPDGRYLRQPYYHLCERSDGHRPCREARHYDLGERRLVSGPDRNQTENDSPSLGSRRASIHPQSIRSQSDRPSSLKPSKKLPAPSKNKIEARYENEPSTQKRAGGDPITLSQSHSRESAGSMRSNHYPSGSLPKARQYVTQTRMPDSARSSSHSARRQHRSSAESKRSEKRSSQTVSSEVDSVFSRVGSVPSPPTSPDSVIDDETADEVNQPKTRSVGWLRQSQKLEQLMPPIEPDARKRSAERSQRRFSQKSQREDSATRAAESASRQHRMEDLERRLKLLEMGQSKVSTHKSMKPPMVTQKTTSTDVTFVRREAVGSRKAHVPRVDERKASKEMPLKVMNDDSDRIEGVSSVGEDKPDTTNVDVVEQDTPPSTDEPVPANHVDTEQNLPAGANVPAAEIEAFTDRLIKLLVQRWN